MEKVYRYTDIQLAALEAAIADKMEYYATDEEKAHLAIKAMMINDLCLKRHIDSEFIYERHFEEWQKEYQRYMQEI